MRTRLLAAGAVAVVAVVAIVVIGVVVGRGDADLSAADRDLLTEALAAEDPLAATASLAADADTWSDLVAASGPDLATLLDRAQGPLAAADDRAERSAAVVGPWLEGEAVDDEVLGALSRWAWPLLAAEVGEAPARDLAGRVVARADEGDDERDAVGGAVGLARIHRAITSPADGDDAITAWRSDLAGAAIQDGDGDADERRSALADVRFQDIPGRVARAALTTWGEPGAASAPVRAVIAELPVDGVVGAGSVLTVASYLAVIDDTADVVAAGAVAGLAAEADGLVALEDALLSSDDPTLRDVGDRATLLLSA